MSCIDHGRKGNKYGYSTTSYMGCILPLHRAIYLRIRGLSNEVLRGLVVRHTCDNPRCINPFHLLQGTYKDNTQDSVERGRNVRGTLVGCAKLTVAQVEAVRNEYIPYHKEHGSAAIARRLGVNQSSISEAIRGVTYKELV